MAGQPSCPPWASQAARFLPATLTPLLLQADQAPNPHPHLLHHQVNPPDVQADGGRVGERRGAPASLPQMRAVPGPFYPAQWVNHLCEEERGMLWWRRSNRRWWQRVTTLSLPRLSDPREREVQVLGTRSADPTMVSNVPLGLVAAHQESQQASKRPRMEPHRPLTIDTREQKVSHEDFMWVSWGVKDSGQIRPLWLGVHVEVGSKHQRGMCWRGQKEQRSCDRCQASHGSAYRSKKVKLAESMLVEILRIWQNEKDLLGKKKARAKNNKQADVLPSCWPCCESTAACPRTTLQYHNFVHFAQALFVYLVFVFVFLIDAAPLTTTIQRQWVQSQSLYCYALATCSNAISHFELRVHAMWTATNSFCITVADVKKKDMSLLKPHFQTHE